MQLYVKFMLLVALFLGLASISGETGREQAWEVSLGARAYFAQLLGDKELQNQLVAEAHARMYGAWIRDILAPERSAEVQQLHPRDFGQDANAGSGNGDRQLSPTPNTEIAAASL